MVPEAPPQSKIPTKTPQPARVGARRHVSPARDVPRSRRTARPGALLRGDSRAATRGDSRVVVELECGVTVYPARGEGGRWRAVWYENGARRQCEAASEDRLAARLEKVTERLAADAPNLERPGADLIAWYLSPARHPAGRAWSAKHADTQRRLCQRFVAPVIAAITCQDIKVPDMQQAVNAAPTAGEGARLHRCLSAMVTAGITGGYLTNPRLRQVHWQPAARPAPGPQVSMQGEAAQFVDPSEIPAAADVARLGQALAHGRRGDLHELMANTAAYTGLRQGELFALTTAQIDPAARVIDVDRKVIEVAGTAAHRRAQGPQAPQDHLPSPHPAGLPAGRQDHGPHPSRPSRAESRRQPARADVPLPPRHLVAVLQLRPPRPGPRLPGGRLARPRRQRPLDLAQPAARAMHHRPVHLETRRHRRLGHGRARQRPHHPGHVRRHHRRRPRPRPHSHRLTLIFHRG